MHESAADAAPVTLACASCNTPYTQGRFCKRCGAQHSPQPRDKDVDDAVPAPQARTVQNSVIPNVLVFVALLLGFLIFVHKYNQGRPKEETMFSGGAPTRVEPMAAGPTGSKGAIQGEVVVDLALFGESQWPGALFIILRNSEQGAAGPPVAVKKVDRPNLPLQFELSEADSMIAGTPFVGPFNLEARLDKDGNALTRAPDDIEMTEPLRGVMPNTQGLVLKLDRRR